MLPRPDPQSFTKLAISAGVFLVIAAFLVPGLVLRETGVLRVSKRELARATPLARDELERRQRLSRTAGQIAPYGGIFLFVGGVILIVYGAPRLKRQEEADEVRSSVELDKLRSEIKPQSEQERAERLKADVEEELRPQTAPGKPGDGSASGPAATISGQDLQDRVRRAGEIERQVLARVERLLPPAYELKANVKIDGRSALLLDGLLVSKVDQLPDVVIEIKQSGAPRLGNARNRMAEAAAMLMNYRSRVQQDAIGWVIFVVEGPVGTPDLERLRELARDFAVALHVSVVQEGDLSTLSFPFSV